MHLCNIIYAEIYRIDNTKMDINICTEHHFTHIYSVEDLAMSKIYRT